MPRRNLIRSDTLPYHVRARSNNREWFALPIQDVWEIFCRKWSEVVIGCGVRLHAFVLMSNHFHALLTTPNANLDAAMQYLLRETAKEINFRSERMNHVFGGPYKWSLIYNRFAYERVTRYVFQNPVKAKLCLRVEDYPFSTLHYQNSHERLPFPLSISWFDMQNVMDVPLHAKLEWLNEIQTDEERARIRRALSHAQFVKYSREKVRHT